MSINHLPEDALATAASMGWNEESVLIHLVGFIEENDLSEDLDAYARDAAAEEDVEVDDTATYDDVVEEAGWDEDSQIIHIAGLIKGKNLDGELGTYFEEIADEEREASDEEDEDDLEEL